MKINSPQIGCGVALYTCIETKDMATVATNVVTNGLSGKLGNELVFRTMRGKTFVSIPARKPNKKKESAAQRNTRVTFKQAAQWAQVMLLDPERKVYYQQRARTLKLPNAYTAAISDYMRTPEVKVQRNETNMTLQVKKKGFDLKEVKLVLVKPDNETETHFVPLICSGVWQLKLESETMVTEQWLYAVNYFGRQWKIRLSDGN
jgi:hypothetical protein